MSSLDFVRGRHRLRWRDPDGSQHTRCFKRKDLAEKLKREVDEDRALGRPWTPRVARTATRLGDAMTAFVVDKSRTLRPGTSERYAYALEMFARFVDDAEATIAILTRQKLADFFAWLRDARTGRHGHQRSVNTCRKQIEVLQVFWKWLAEHDEYAKEVGPPRALEMPAVQRAITVAPTWAEMDACIAAASGWHKQLATILRFTGLRANQAMALLWSDFDLERATLTIRPELGKSDQEARGRVIPISKHLAAILAGWGTREGYVVKSKRGSLNQRVARHRDMDRIWARAGVREAAWMGRPHHAFRKGFTSGLKRLGADDEAVEHLIGHSLGLRGIYTDPEALPLVEAVALIPPLTTTAPAPERQEKTA